MFLWPHTGNREAGRAAQLACVCVNHVFPEVTENDCARCVHKELRALWECVLTHKHYPYLERLNTLHSFVRNNTNNPYLCIINILGVWFRDTGFKEGVWSRSNVFTTAPVCIHSRFKDWPFPSLTITAVVEPAPSMVSSVSARLLIERAFEYCSDCVISVKSFYLRLCNHLNPEEQACLKSLGIKTHILTRKKEQLETHPRMRF